MMGREDEGEMGRKRLLSEMLEMLEGLEGLEGLEWFDGLMVTFQLDFLAIG